MNGLFQDNEKFSAMSNESVEAMNIFAGTNIFVNQKEEVTNVCKAWEEIMNEKHAEGREEGRAEERKSMIKKML